MRSIRLSGNVDRDTAAKLLSRWSHVGELSVEEIWQVLRRFPEATP